MIIISEDKDKQKYGYRPDIEYQDTYESNHSNKEYKTVTDYDNNKNTEMDNITDVFNEVIQLVPMLPTSIQTSINNVFKPVVNIWGEVSMNIYPVYIPTPGEPIYKPPTKNEPEEEKDFYIKPIPPGDTPPTKPPDDIEDSIIDNYGIWDYDPPIIIEYNPIKPKDIIEMEYIKNIADLFKYYVNRLRNILYHYYSEILMAMYSRKKTDNGEEKKTKEDICFLFDNLTNLSSDFKDDCVHLYDASLAMSEHAMRKICFLENAFPVEQTLFHLKNFKTIYLLRLRYANIEPSDGKDKIESMSNNVLTALKDSYDQKYDVAFTALYKYLNSSLEILDDALNTELAGLKARRTIIEKGAFKK